MAEIKLNKLPLFEFNKNNSRIRIIYAYIHYTCIEHYFFLNYIINNIYNYKLQLKIIFAIACHNFKKLESVVTDPYIMVTVSRVGHLNGRVSGMQQYY